MANDHEWELVENLLPAHINGRPIDQPARRALLAAVLYLQRTNQNWEYLPIEYLRNLPVSHDNAKLAARQFWRTEFDNPERWKEIFTRLGNDPLNPHRRLDKQIALRRNYGLDDQQWQELKDLMPNHAGGRALNETQRRNLLEAVVFRQRAAIGGLHKPIVVVNGVPQPIVVKWTDLPQRFGNPLNLKNSYDSISRENPGLWRRVFTALSRDEMNSYLYLDERIAVTHLRRTRDKQWQHVASLLRAQPGVAQWNDAEIEALFKAVLRLHYAKAGWGKLPDRFGDSTVLRDRYLAAENQQPGIWATVFASLQSCAYNDPPIDAAMLNARLQQLAAEPLRLRANSTSAGPLQSIAPQPTSQHSILPTAASAPSRQQPASHSSSSQSPSRTASQPLRGVKLHRTASGKKPPLLRALLTRFSTNIKRSSPMKQIAANRHWKAAMAKRLRWSTKLSPNGLERDINATAE